MGSSRLAYKHSNASLPLTEKKNRRIWAGGLKDQIVLQYNSMIYKILCKFTIIWQVILNTVYHSVVRGGTLKKKHCLGRGRKIEKGDRNVVKG